MTRYKIKPIKQSSGKGATATPNTFLNNCSIILFLFHGSEASPSGRGVPGGRVKEKEQQREEEAKIPAENLLNEVDLQAKKEGIKIKKEVVEESDTVGKAIIDYAKKNNMDVIVIGTTGMSAVEEIFLGSVANNVIHHAHCPVFAIR